MKTLFITLMTAFVFTLNATAFAKDGHDHKHEKTEKHNEHYAEGDHAQHDDHVDHKENTDKKHDDHAHDHSEDKTKGDK